MPAPDDAISITALQSRPGRAVFTEEGNSDRWIATDVTVAVLR